MSAGGKKHFKKIVIFCGKCSLSFFMAIEGIITLYLHRSKPLGQGMDLHLKQMKF